MTHRLHRVIDLLQLDVAYGDISDNAFSYTAVFKTATIGTYRHHKILGWPNVCDLHTEDYVNDPPATLRQVMQDVLIDMLKGEDLYFDEKEDSLVCINQNVFFNRAHLNMSE